MAFPTIPTAAANTLLSSTTSTASTTHTFPSLTTLAPAAGDLIIAICVQYDGTTSGQFSSWGASLTEILDSQSTGTGAGALGVAYKIATGSESGTFTVTSADSFKSVNFLMRIPQTTWHGVITPEVQTPTRAAGAVADPGSFDPNNWGAEDTLWISLGAHTETTTAGSPPTLDSPPTNFSGQLIVARAADAVGDITAGVSFRQQNAAAQDVGTWTTSNATRGNGIASVIAVPPKIPFAKTGEIAVSPRAASGERNGVYSRTGAGRIDVSEKKIIDSVNTGSGESGCSVAISGNGSIVVMGARSQSGGGNAFVYTGTNWSTETKLAASDRESGDHFGTAVAISRDGSIIAVGSHYDDSLRGAVYMYSGTNWATETKLVASDREANDTFGESVALSPDGSILAVGAHGENDMGAVYIYTGTNWSTETKLVASDRAAGDKFGCSVALSDDGSILAVGAFFEDGAGSDRGAVYMYSGTNWATETKLVASDAINSDWFGTSVALSGDGSILAVGSSRVGADLGAIYMCTGTNWGTQQKLGASDLQADDRLGFSVDLSKDGSILVGGMYRQSGHCSVYLYGPPSYTEYRRLVPFEGIGVGAGNNQFGSSVAVSDNGSTVLVGAQNAGSRGASYVFTPKGLSGGGTKTTLTKQGSASAVFKGSAISASEFDRSGIAKSIFTASGVDVATYQKKNDGGIGVGSEFTGGGVYEKIGDSGNTYQKKNDAGTGVGTDFVGNGTDAAVWSKQGIAVSDQTVGFTASAPKSLTYTKSGTAISDAAPANGFTATAADEVTYAEAGVGISDFVASGVSEAPSSGIVKTGLAVIGP